MLSCRLSLSSWPQLLHFRSIANTRLACKMPKGAFSGPVDADMAYVVKEHQAQKQAVPSLALQIIQAG